MKAKVIEDADVVTYVVVCDPGDEAVSALTQFARAERLEAAQITAVGAFEHAIVGWFDREARDYRRIPVDEQCELLSLIGDVAEGQDGPIVFSGAIPTWVGPGAFSVPGPTSAASRDPGLGNSVR